METNIEGVFAVGNVSEKTVVIDVGNGAMSEVEAEKCILKLGG
jgi:thioredoxin reductase